MIWKVPPIWEGSRCFIIGGGPSMPYQFGISDDIISAVCKGEKHPNAYEKYMTCIKDEHVIGINNAYMLAKWIDIIFFGDCDYYRIHRLALSKFPGLKVTCCPKFANRSKEQMEGIKYLQKYAGRKHGISDNPAKVSWNSNSGAAAISLAYHLGVKQVYLLGFDMKINQQTNDSHWHGNHIRFKEGGKKQDRKLKIKGPPFNRHLKGFPAIAKDAKQFGIEIINLSPESEINVFHKGNLKDVINA